MISISVSIASFGMLGGSLIAGPCANIIGRKWTSIFGTCGSLALGYSLFSGAQYVWMMLLGRFLQGAGLGFSTTVSTIYIMEVGSCKNRKVNYFERRQVLKDKETDRFTVSSSSLQTSSLLFKHTHQGKIEFRA